MMKERRKWSKVSVICFALAVILPVISKLLPRPGEEVEAVVEQYLLTRVGLMVAMAAFAFLGLFVISKYLRCPHCDAMGLSLKAEATVCRNCGYDFVTCTPKEEPAETEAVEAVEVSAAVEPAELPEAAEASNEEK